MCGFAVWMCVALCGLLGDNVAAQWIHPTSDSYKEENEVCRREGDSVWLCKKDTECPAAKTVLQNYSRLATCSWRNSTTHIVCCPPDRSVGYSTSISERKCSEYQKLLCKSTIYQGQFSKQVNRRKRRTQDGFITSSMSSKGEKVIRHSIIGGKLSKPKEFQSMALIGYGDADSIKWECGGSLISERFVLSAAHCSLTSYGPARWVRLGDLDISTDKDDARPQQFEIIERVVHRDYKAPAFYNDIVLFRIDRAAVFDQYVGPACLHTSLEDPVGLGIATGWGRNESSGPKSSFLVKVGLKFLPVEECKRDVGTLKEYLPTGLDTRTMLCAGEPGKDTCQGDSGGPLMLADRGNQCLAKQVGITSFGPRNCGMAHVTGTYVRVAHFVSWIESVVWPE